MFQDLGIEFKQSRDDTVFDKDMMIRNKVKSVTTKLVVQEIEEESKFYAETPTNSAHKKTLTQRFKFFGE